MRGTLIPLRRNFVAKKLKTVLRLQIEAGKANPAPPIGPALAPHGINLMAFCKDYNARTSNKMGEIIPAEISIYMDGSFTFILIDLLSLIFSLWSIFILLYHHQLPNAFCIPQEEITTRIHRPTTLF